MKELTPREIMRELDRYIVGQTEAKRAVAVALRNRYRRAHVDEPLRSEIIPKNILMIGPTGVGKTEIARRLAKLVSAPFIKVEATKFTEVGYVGRDVESIIRDLMENAVRMVRDEFEKRVETRASVLAEDRLVTLLVSPPKKSSGNPFELLLGGKKEPDAPPEEQEALRGKREEIRQRLRAGELEERELEIEVADAAPELEVGGNTISIGDMMGGMLPKRTKIRRVKVKEARRLLTQEEADKLIDEDAVREEAVRRAEQDAIVFIDEIDKIAGRGGNMGGGPDVSREGVQRDVLPIVEGSTVNTKYGAVKTDHMLFIAAGAFHVAKVTDLIPELQGRFPVHVKLNSLTQEDFKSILTQPENALSRQYEALLAVDKVFLSFEDSAIDAIAHAAFVLNESSEDIGARRLHAVFEKLLEDVAFNAGGDEMPNVYLSINGDYVVEHLGTDEGKLDPRRYIL